jgi:glycosyltransferase involved in cell wall biosynthesis
MKISVIVTTYNNLEHLKRVVTGLMNQSIKNFELVIADDGSKEETKLWIDNLKEKSKLKVKHVWHEDRGFRKCEILNKAVVESEGEYLIFLDGDCVPRKNMVETHIKSAREDRYVTGGKVLLTQEMTDNLKEEDIIKNKLEQMGMWCLKLKRTRRVLISYIPGLRYLFDRKVKRLPGWRGENASTYKKNILNVNGFDERFAYGYEDADFGHRLEKNGVLGYSIRYTCPVFHLEHGRSYAQDERNKKNIEYYNENREKQITWTDFGIEK